MELKFKKLQEDAVLPSYANPNDAGLDLTAISFTQEFDKSGKLVLVYHTGLSVEIPEGHMGLIFMRSSISQRSMSMCNAVGVIKVRFLLNSRLLQMLFLQSINQVKRLLSQQ